MEGKDYIIKRRTTRSKTVVIDFNNQDYKKMMAERIKNEVAQLIKSEADQEIKNEEGHEMKSEVAQENEDRLQQMKGEVAQESEDRLQQMKGEDRLQQMKSEVAQENEDRLQLVKNVNLVEISEDTPVTEFSNKIVLSVQQMIEKADAKKKYLRGRKIYPYPVNFPGYQKVDFDEESSSQIEDKSSIFSLYPEFKYTNSSTLIKNEDCKETEKKKRSSVINSSEYYALNRGITIEDKSSESVKSEITLSTVKDRILFFENVFTKNSNIKNQKKLIQKKGINKAFVETNKGSEETNKVSQEIDKVSQETNKVSQEIDKVSQETNKVSQDINKVSQDINKVSQEIDKVSQEIDKPFKEILIDKRDNEESMKRSFSFKSIKEYWKNLQ
jgi:hypothetical protein